MTFAIIPWAEKFAGDKIFDNSLHRDGSMMPFIKMREEFIRKGHIVHTIDYFEDIKSVDFFLFFILDWDWLIKLVRLNMEHKMVYCNAEPPSVDYMNTLKGYRLYRCFFPYILTWNDEWLDEKSIFKRNIPYYFEDKRLGARDYQKKKLLTLISSNNSSNYCGELYSERKNAINYFENEIPNDFDFYGVGWENDRYICYKGMVVNKFEIYHSYRFAICYENIRGYSGYISEKIFDCFISGIVPIYCGASNICDYVPRQAFILLDDFASYDELKEYLVNMNEEEYSGYLRAADMFLKSTACDEFKGEKYADYILQAVNMNKADFKVSIKGLFYLWRRLFFQKRQNIIDKLLS